MNSASFRILAGRLLLATLVALAAMGATRAQDQPSASDYKSQEVSEIDGLPVLIKHLPDWEARRNRIVFATSAAELKNSLGDRQALDLIDFTGGTEAVTTQYDAGKLLIVEYSNPQSSVDADTKFQRFLAEAGDPTTMYRRIGNYNVLVFDVTDTTAAEALIGQVKYEKQIHWLGKNPFLISAERAFVLTTGDIFFSTAWIVVFGIAVSIVLGIFAGYIFFTFRDGKRSKKRTFTDAGGMTRLNLDGLIPDVNPERVSGD